MVKIAHVAATLKRDGQEKWRDQIQFNLIYYMNLEMR